MLAGHISIHHFLRAPYRSVRVSKLYLTWQDSMKAKIDKNVMLQEQNLFINLDKKLKIGKI